MCWHAVAGSIKELEGSYHFIETSKSGCLAPCPRVLLDPLACPHPAFLDLPLVAVSTLDRSPLLPLSPCP
eukprot:612545-Hanusia_phi.AAC.1